MFSAFSLLLLALCLVQPESTLAQDARHCISQSQGMSEYSREKSHVLTNTCPTEVHVFWCLNQPAAKYSNLACNDEKFYRQITALKPGEQKLNPSSLPANEKLIWGACYGGRESLHTTGTRSYGCEGAPPAVTDVLSVALCPQDRPSLFHCYNLLEDSMNIQVSCEDGRKKTVLLEARLSKTSLKGAITMRSNNSGRAVVPVDVMKLTKEDFSFVTNPESVPDTGSQAYKIYDAILFMCKDAPTTSEPVPKKEPRLITPPSRSAAGPRA